MSKRKESEADAQMGQDKLTEVLWELDGRLAGRRSGISPVVVGGAPLVLEFGHRATDDVDCIDIPLPDDVKEIIADIGRRHNIRENWMNDGPAEIANFMSLPQNRRPIFEGDNMIIMSPDHRFLLAMKLAASRPKDDHDGRILSKHLGIRSEEELIQLLKDAFLGIQISEQQIGYIRRILK